MPKKTKPVTILLVLIAIGIALYREYRAKQDGPAPTEPSRKERRAEAPPAEGPFGGRPPARGTDGVIENAFREKRSKVWVEAEGVVVHLLPDDRVGNKHQRFLLDLPSGHTIKISHNIDLADRIPVRKGDRVRFRGRFEYNDKGGAVHWTHHDPRGRREGGWLEIHGKRYR